MYIEILFEFLFSVLGEVLLQLAFELPIEWGLRSAAEGFRSRKRADTMIAAVGLLLLGSVVGLLVSLLVPGRILNFGQIRGASIVLSPLVTGLVMDIYGRWRERRNGERSYFATFWGGALFAFGMALVRFLMVGGA